MAGVTGASAATCGMGLLSGTSTWCSGLIWFVGNALGIATAILLGFPVALLYRKARITHWSAFLVGGDCSRLASLASTCVTVLISEVGGSRLVRLYELFGQRRTGWLVLLVAQSSSNRRLGLACRLTARSGHDLMHKFPVPRLADAVVLEWADELAAQIGRDPEDLRRSPESISFLPTLCGSN